MVGSNKEVQVNKHFAKNETRKQAWLNSRFVSAYQHAYAASGSVEELANTMENVELNQIKAELQKVQDRLAALAAKHGINPDLALSA